MTLVVAWPNKAKSTTSLHFAADTRVSCNGTYWDYATKIWRVRPTHDWVAYTGSSLYALSAIHQFMAVVDWTEVLRGTAERVSCNGTTRSRSTGPRARAGGFVVVMRDIMATFPTSWGSQATFLYGGFDKNMGQFELYEIALPNGEPTCIPLNKGPVCRGSGAKAAKKLLSQLKRVNTQSVLKVLAQVIQDTGVPGVGGFPQMAIIKKDKSTPQAFNGQVNGKKRAMLFGVPLELKGDLPRVQFRDESFAPVHNASCGRIIPVGTQQTSAAPRRAGRRTSPSPSTST